MSTSARLIAAALLLLGAPAVLASAPLLQAPAAGATLRGGTFATLAWSADALPDAPPDAEEWEAFLSVDGGGYYAFRITPHLDIARRTFIWLVPNVETQNARILMRTGDERREARYVLPGSFRIVRDAEAPAMLPAMTAPEGAEAAREGEADVLSWEEGTRAGTDVMVRCAPARRGVSLTGRTVAEALDEWLEERTLRTSASAEPVVCGRVAEFPRISAHSVVKSSDLLLACRRRNI